MCTTKLSGWEGSAGAIRAGQGVMAGRLSSGIRQQLLKIQLCTVSVDSVLCAIDTEQFTEESPVANTFRAVWYCGGGALGGIVATGMSLALMGAILGTLGTCYFEVLCDGKDQSYRT